MREHLYCGKRKDNGEWVEGSLLYQGHGKAYIITHDVDFGIVAFCEECNVPYDASYGDGGSQFEVIPETVGEYTGLTDRKSNKIFEGWIIEDIYSHKRLIVAWDDLNACFALITRRGGTVHYEYNDYIMDDIHELEVVGNVYDNPELLEENHEE